MSLPRLIVGTNWFLGYSHVSKAKDRFITEFQTRDRIAEVLGVFLSAGIDAVLGPVSPLLIEAVRQTEDCVGRPMHRILTPSFNLRPGGNAANDPEPVFDQCRAMGAAFCLPHTSVTDALVDRLNEEIRDIGRYTRMIRERDMIPGLSTHMPEAVVLADKTDADVETYIQIYNCAGFLMPLEIDWIMRIIHRAKKPVIAIKPLAAGRILPPVGLAFAWSTLRQQDLVCVGTTTPDEAREVIDLSLDFLAQRAPDLDLQRTRSKKWVE